MSLLKKWQKKHLQPAATAIVATVATKAEINPPTVAVVAEIAVADAQKQINEQADLTSAHMARTEQESALYDARLLSFKGKGMSNDAANAIAKRLIERDNDQADDRRSCAECKSFYANRCKRHISPIGGLSIYTLHRCKGFTE